MLIKKKKNQGNDKNFKEMIVYVADSGIFARFCKDEADSAKSLEF